MPKTTLIWDNFIDDAEAQDYMDNYNSNRVVDEEGIKTLDEARTTLYDDHMYWQMRWEDFLMGLQELMSDHAYWRDDATNMGWRNRTGYKVFKAEHAGDLIDAITPNTSDFSLRITPHYKGFKVRISHHDAPMGEHHIVRPITEREFENNN